MSAAPRSIRKPALGLLGVVAFMASPTFAQSRHSQSIVGVSNTGSAGISNLDFADSNIGALVTATVNNKTFTGLDRNGVSRTMTFSGQTRSSAEYGRLRVYTTGSVSNTYYNASNPVYDAPSQPVNPNGSPESLSSLGFAIFDDTLQFGGSLSAGYQVRYIFHIDGTNTGYGTLVDMAVNIAGQEQAGYFNGDTGFTSTNYATNSVQIDGTHAQTIHVQFSTQVVFNTIDVADGSTLSGTSNFGATATLDQVQVLDANGNPVSNVTVTGTSGTVYNTAPVPEPVSAMALGGFILVARRRR